MTFVGPLLVALPTVLNLLVWLQGASGFAGLAGAASSATPVLAGVGTTITGTILPALSGLATTIMGGVTTALSGIASLVTGTVIPAVMALGPALLAALPYVAIAAAIGFIIYALWRLKGEYDSAAEAAERANESFRELEAMENRAVAEGKADADILAAQKAEREAAPVTLSDRFWGAMTGGGRTSRDIARDRVAAGQESAAFATMRRRAEAREQNITVNVQGNVIGDVDIERKVSEGVSRANRQAAAAQ
jgi:hypothetical protein